MPQPSRPLRIAIVTDAYFPQISGVATTIAATKEELEKRGHHVLVIAPRDFKWKIAAPTYPEIKIVLFPYQKLTKLLDAFQPDALHIAVEGSLGHAASKYAKKHTLHFTTAYHTRFPEYVQVRFHIPLSWSYAFMRNFHNSAAQVMVAADNLKQELEARGFKNLVLWTRGVDTKAFSQDNPHVFSEPKPIFIYMGRVAPEKNLETFLSLELPGTTYIVGDGPSRIPLSKKYPKAVFTGYKTGEELSQYLAGADVFVFPSLTDTLGLVMLEANACGLPVAALPSQASSVVIQEGENGVTSTDLKDACMRALSLSRTRCREIAVEHGWKQPTDLFLEHLNPRKKEGE